MDLWGGRAVVIGCPARKLSLQHHLRALWEDKVVKETRGTGCLVEPEFLQGREENPFLGRSSGWSGRVVIKADLDKFEQRASLEERYQIPNGDLCSSCESEPREGREV